MIYDPDSDRLVGIGDGAKRLILEDAAKINAPAYSVRSATEPKKDSLTDISNTILSIAQYPVKAGPAERGGKKWYKVTCDLPPQYEDITELIVELQNIAYPLKDVFKLGGVTIDVKSGEKAGGHPIVMFFPAESEGLFRKVYEILEEKTGKKIESEEMTYQFDISALSDPTDIKKLRETVQRRGSLKLAELPY